MHIHHEEQLEMPRFTSTLRAFSKVSQKQIMVDVDLEKRNLRKRIQQLNENSLASSSTVSTIVWAWSDVLQKLTANDNQKEFKLKSLLEKLRSTVAKQFLNEDFNDATLLSEAALYLVDKFYEHKSTNYNYSTSTPRFQNLDKLSKILRQKFGPFQRNLFDSCRVLMETIFEEVEVSGKSELFDDIFGKYEALEDKQSSSKETLFGQNIQFYSFYDKDSWKEIVSGIISEEDDDEVDRQISPDEESDIEEGQMKKELQFNFLSKTPSVDSETDYLVSWTRKLSPEMCPIVYELLSKQTATDQIQNELVELLGFENIELTEFLISNREEVTKAYKSHFVDRTAIQRKKPMNVLDTTESAAGRQTKLPETISSDIMVHTEAEKRLQKQLRKEDRKLQRQADSRDTSELIQFDPSLLRKLREEQLSEARVLQHYQQFQQQRLLRDPLEKRIDPYPHVFDALAKIRQSSAFVGGSKVLLPETMKRDDNRDNEQIHIPAVDPMAMLRPEQYVGTKEEVCFRPFIKISDLDEIAQLAFRGTQSLNRIQSVVFHEAYETNDNLLICAPTGAGKTNIAMLTIVNQIRQNIIDGVLRKDAFKIVYIAPMKALAAEMVANFSKRLEPLGIVVRELTGDIQLTKQEIMQTQMLVATPEKWDVVTRKSLGDVSLSLLVRLLIIDEVHLLHDDRGSVIETIVARTLRQVESSQKMIRVVGLSATLPNYLDVARFLGVNPSRGLFFFDSRFRPVPLAQTFIGVKSLNKMKQIEQMEEAAYDKALSMVRQGHQVMIFVHARNATVKTAMKMRDMAKNLGDIELFRPESNRSYGEAQREMSRSKNKLVRELFDDGFSCHHAGMLRADRNLVERAFTSGHIRVLCCTATLAWGVNLPAHAVIIKGTELYDSKKGSFVDLSMLDVLQIFGRAGRPQFDKSGEAFIITTHAKLSVYLSLLTQQSPIESQFVNNLADNLNAEICLGSVTNVSEACKWLTYTYLHVRMKSNPLAYGLTYKNLENDPSLEQHRTELIKIAARLLDKAHMVRFDEMSGQLNATDLGRTASHYYINYDTIEVTNAKLLEAMSDKQILAMISECSEFQQIKVRDEEMTELDQLHEACVLPVIGGIESATGKVNCLIQMYVSRERVDGFSLISDMSYVAQNVVRIGRALFEMTLKRGWPVMSGRLLNICKSLEKRLWHFQSPMRQFEGVLNFEILQKIEDSKMSIEQMQDLDGKELGILLRHVKMGEKVKECLNYLPQLDIETSLHPITRTVLRVKISLKPAFNWNDRVHGVGAEPFWVWIEDPFHNHIYHHEYVNAARKQVRNQEPLQLVFTIPIFEPLPPQYIIRVISDRWLGVETSHSVSFKHLILPDQHPPHTELLDLDPLPLTALDNPAYQALYKFSHFNPVQTQIFHCLYHTDHNCLLGAPTGSGKTIAAELAMFRVFTQSDQAKADAAAKKQQVSGKKCVYIAPLKALVRERMEDWKIRLEAKLGKKVVELTGDTAPDMRAIELADVIVTTPEKWDGISRSWQTRHYVKDVALIVIDEIHLLGEDRGPVLEVIVSRTNFITHHTSSRVRVVGLSTALANARDLADWLGIKQMGLYNFKPSVRPVPLEVHIQGYPGKFYCPRMATMNKPCFQEIQIHSNLKPVLIFVSSRRQTRITALDLISCLATDNKPKQWLHMSEVEMSNLTSQVIDQNLKLTLAFGIGLHHAGLNERDRSLVEELFCNQKIQVLIATSTLAWGVNFPAHLVIVKGTEYFDGKLKRYVDFPITDVLQMMGRAGRPQFDDQGVAVIMVHDVKKHFYKKFLYEPFPVESSLLAVLADHLNAEIVASTINSKQEAVDYLTWTYFFRRLLVNPSYYELESLDNSQINVYLSDLIQSTINELEESSCVETDENSLTATTLGRITSFYYLSHLTTRTFKETLDSQVGIEDLLQVVSSAQEFAELPVRHNEDKMNAELSKDLPLKVNAYTFDSPHTKCNLLLQAHFSRAPLPSTDYITDTKSVLDQCLRVMQAILDICAQFGWLSATLSILNLMQMTCQGRWHQDSDILCLPHIEAEHLTRFFNNKQQRIDCLPRLIDYVEKKNYENVLEDMVGDLLDLNQIRMIYQTLKILPQIELDLSITGPMPSAGVSTNVKRILIDGLNPEKEYELFEEEDYVLNLNIRRISKAKGSHDQKGGSFRAYCPKMHKSKDENWVAILGTSSKDSLNSELISLKRISNFKMAQNSSLAFKTPRILNETKEFAVTLFFMSDVYLGLDQQFEIKFKLISVKSK